MLPELWKCGVFMKAIVQSPFALERAGIVGLVNQVWPAADVIAASDRAELSTHPRWDEGVDLLVVDWRSSAIARDLMESFVFGENKSAPVVVVFCDGPDLTATRNLVALGAKAVVPLCLSPALVAAMLPFVVAGGTYIPPSVLDSGSEGQPFMAADGGGMTPRYRGDDPAFNGLTRRQREVLRHIANGLSNEEIALELGVTLNTVKSHVSSMLRALGVKRRTQAMRMLSDRAPVH